VWQSSVVAVLSLPSSSASLSLRPHSSAIPRRTRASIGTRPCVST
jgi:hypothetical protein